MRLVAAQHFSGVPNYTSREVDERLHIKDGDILVSWSATLDAFFWQRGPALLNQHIFKVVPRRGSINPRFLYYQLKHIISSMSRGEHAHGSTMKHINRKSFLAHPFWRPCLEHQERIGQLLDKLFSDLVDAERTLQAIQAKLKQARASILKAAVEGRLVPTEAELARAQHRGYEHAEDLLRRVLSARKVKHESRQEGMARRTSLKKSESPVVPDGQHLPEGWAWASLDELSGVIRNGFSGKPSEDGPVEILRISAVRPMLVNNADIRRLPGVIDDYAGSIANNGDLLVTRYNGNPDLVGAMGLLRCDKPLVHPDKLIRVTLVTPEVKQEWVEVSFNTGLTRDLLRSRIRTTAGQAGISGGDLKVMPVPLPPAAEQQRIVDEVDRRFSVLDKVESTVEANLARCTKLRQAILKRAFEGRLVPAA
jgi:type I restriction enzyme S subunit